MTKLSSQCLGAEANCCLPTRPTLLPCSPVLLGSGTDSVPCTGSGRENTGSGAKLCNFPDDHKFTDSMSSNLFFFFFFIT